MTAYDGRANTTVPAGLDRSVARPQALPVADRARRPLAGVHRDRDVGADRLGRVVLDRPDRDPRRRAGRRPRRRARPFQPARRRDRGAGEGPLLPLGHLPLPADPVRRVRRRDVPDRARRPVHPRPGRHRGLHRLHRRDRDQHRPRARPQEGVARALAVEDRSGAELLRPLLHRAQPWPPRPRRDPGGPRVVAARRDLLRVLAADRPRLAAVGVEPREAPDRPPQAAPLAAVQRRPQRVADVGGAVGCAHRVARRRHHAVPGDPGGRGPVVARGRQLHGALRHAPAAGRRRGAGALRTGRPVALVELQQHRHQRAALPPPAAQRPPRQPDPALPVAARLRGEPRAADGLCRDDPPRPRPAGVATGHGRAGGRPLRRRHQPGQHLPPPARARPRAVRRWPGRRRSGGFETLAERGPSWPVSKPRGPAQRAGSGRRGAGVAVPVVRLHL